MLTYFGLVVCKLKLKTMNMFRTQVRSCLRVSAAVFASSLMRPFGFWMGHCGSWVGCCGSPMGRSSFSVQCCRWEAHRHTHTYSSSTPLGATFKWSKIYSFFHGFFSCSYSCCHRVLRVGKRISWLCLHSWEQRLFQGTWSDLCVTWRTYSCYCTWSYIGKFNTLRKLCRLNDQIIHK